MKILAALTIGLVICAQSSIAAPAKQSIAAASPGATPPSAVRQQLPVPRTGQAKAVSRSQIKRKAKSSYPRTHFERAKYFKQKGNLNAALVEYLRATQDNPRLVAAYYEQAVIFRQRGFLKLAESSLERALAVNKEFHQGRILLATVQLEQGNFGGAVEELSRSLGLAAPTSTISRQPKSDEKAVDKVPEQTETNPVSILQSLHEFLPEPFGDSVRKSTPSKELRDRDDETTSGKIASVASRKRQSTNRVATDDDVDDDAGSASGKDVQSDESKQDDSFFSIQVRLPNPLKMFNWLSEDSRDKQKAKKASRSKPSKRQDRSEKDEVATDTAGGIEHEMRKPRSWMSKFMQLPEQPVESDRKDAPIEERVAEKKTDDELSSAESVKGWDAKASALESSAAVAQEPAAAAPEPAAIAPEPVAVAIEPAAVAPDTTISSESSNASLQFKLADKPWNLPLPSFTGTGFFAAFNRLYSNVSPVLTPEKKTPAAPEDEWVKRLRYLNENGTATLKDGEAFMFSEDTGEAVLILASGKRIQRIIAQPQDAQEVLKLRRPDVLIPQELMYNLSLLGRLMPKEEPVVQRPAPITVQQSPSITSSQSASELDKPFATGEMLGKREGIFDWFRGILKL